MDKKSENVDAFHARIPRVNFFIDGDDPQQRL